MNRASGQILGGGLLIAGGLLPLLQGPGYLGGGEPLWALLFVLGGFAFIATYIGERQRRWALIPGGALPALALTLALSARGAGGDTPRSRLPRPAQSRLRGRLPDR